MRAALTMDVLATDLADYLVRKGVRILSSDSPRPVTLTFYTHHVDPLPRDAPCLRARSCAGRGAPVPDQRAHVRGL